MKRTVLVLFMVLLASSQALAHKVMVFGYVEDGKVKTISKFSGGKKVMGGKITVYDVDGKHLLEGVTDDNGEFTFDIPSRKGLRIELEATMGHKNVSEISAAQLGSAPDPAGDEPMKEDVSGTVEKKEPVAKIPSPSMKKNKGVEKAALERPIQKIRHENPAEHPVPSSRMGPGEQDGPVIESIGEAQMEAAVEKVLDRKVMPLLEMMAEREDKPGFAEVAGGIGYIVGLMGLYLYMKNRKER